jgi:DNA repair exonuclease SbcCD ATPase subunit
MKTRALAAVATAALMLQACAWLNVAPPPAGDAAESWWSGRSEGDEVLALLAYYQRMAAASAEDQRKEFNAVSQIFARDKGENARIKVALLLSLPNVAFRDDARLASLLEASASRNAGPESPRRQLVGLLSRLTAERQRLTGQLREEHRKLESQFRDEQKRADEQQKRADDLQKRGDELQKRADELQDKLDKLLAIERELRARTPRRPLR